MKKGLAILIANPLFFWMNREAMETGELGFECRGNAPALTLDLQDSWVASPYF